MYKDNFLHDIQFAGIINILSSLMIKDKFPLLAQINFTGTVLLLIFFTIYLNMRGKSVTFQIEFIYSRNRHSNFFILKNIGYNTSYSTCIDNKKNGIANNNIYFKQLCDIKGNNQQLIEIRNLFQDKNIPYYLVIDYKERRNIFFWKYENKSTEIPIENYSSMLKLEK